MVFPCPAVMAVDINHQKPLTEIFVLVESCFYFNILLSGIFSHFHKSAHLLPLLDFRSLQFLKFCCLTRSLCTHMLIGTPSAPLRSLQPPLTIVIWQVLTCRGTFWTADNRGTFSELKKALMKPCMILLALRYLLGIVLPHYTESNCAPVKFDKL